MHTVWLPAHFPILLRRVVNVLSTFSIAHHYFRPLRAPSEREKENTSTIVEQLSFPWRAENYLVPQLADIPREYHAGLYEREHEREPKGTYILQASGFSIPWPRLRWPSRISLFGSTTTDSHKPASDDTDTDADSSPSPASTPPKPAKPRPPPDALHQLLQSPVLYDPLRAPRNPIVLCHGLYGFDVRGPSVFPSLKMHYWSSILGILRKTVGAEVIVTSVPGTGSIASRAEELHRFLEKRAPGRGLNLLAHSMGGLDCRQLITHIRPETYTPLSLTTVATPHRGSAFMDWCTEYLGLGRAQSPPAPAVTLSLASLPSSFTTMLLSLFDSPAYANLTTAFLTEHFNPRTPDDPRVRYFSVAARARPLNVWHPLWLPKLVLDGAEERALALEREHGSGSASGLGGTGEDETMRGNDGLVSVRSARWGEFLGTMEGCDHWELRGASGLEFGAEAGEGEGERKMERGKGARVEREAQERWGLGDWGRFVRALGRAERRSLSASLESEKERERARGGRDLGRRRGGEKEREMVREREREREREDVLRSSTDRLSAVFDWIVEQVPVEALALRLGSDKDKEKAKDGDKVKVEKKEKAAKEKERKSDLETGEDLERFYVALSRKLYDEGL
ncbi:alpha/beta-hydrolase [Dentipellis sp. KUC8613]|nr:alpha/beta-hydrolase [Dentipellis sp. KUC8613]